MFLTLGPSQALQDGLERCGSLPITLCQAPKTARVHLQAKLDAGERRLEFVARHPQERIHLPPGVLERREFVGSRDLAFTPPTLAFQEGQFLACDDQEQETESHGEGD